MVAVSAICADTDERAAVAVRPGGAVVPPAAGRHAGSRWPAPEEAAAYPYSDQEREFARDRFTGQAVGSPETVRQQLTGLLERTAADELMLTTMVYDLAGPGPLLRADHREGRRRPGPARRLTACA